MHHMKQHWKGVCDKDLIEMQHCLGLTEIEAGEKQLMIRIATFSVPHHGPYVFLQLSLATAYFIVFFSKLFPLHFCQLASWLQLHP